uniref:D-isomer specific 2-hydroxyacid dehydrogenase NAD-binding domain-containing protein n=1 Tax=candidate division WOR-3 bacterium TaxID=2052148 RepID=A0A7C2P1B7_UNCW3
MKNKVLVLIPELTEEQKDLVVSELGEGFEVFFDPSNILVDKIDVLMVFRWEGIVVDTLIEQMKSLKLVQAITAGVDHIPLKKLLEKGIRVQGAPGANSRYIAEHAFAMILSAFKKICIHNQLMRKGEFHQEYMHRTLFDKNMLILGFGTIGQEVAKISEVFKMKLRVFKKNKEIPEQFQGRLERVYTTKAELLEAWPWADVIVVALPLTEELKGFIGSEELERMKKDSIIVNVSRGKIIDEEALYKHLERNPDFIACLDVWWVYPKEDGVFKQNYPFEKLDNVILTPHVAPKVPGYFENMLRTACKKVKEFFE